MSAPGVLHRARNRPVWFVLAVFLTSCFALALALSWPIYVLLGRFAPDVSDRAQRGYVAQVGEVWEQIFGEA